MLNWIVECPSLPAEASLQDGRIARCSLKQEAPSSRAGSSHLPARLTLDGLLLDPD